MKHKQTTFGLLAVSLLASVATAAADVPAGYPADYSEIVKAAEAEGKVVVYAPLDSNAYAPLVADFKTLYPGIEVEFNNLQTTALYNRFISEVAAGSGSADVVWSSAMDLQLKLANDGYAQAYESPETKNLPSWAVWDSKAYGITFEPIVFVYNKDSLTPDDLPKGHADVVEVLRKNKDKFQGQVIAYDIEKSGIGFLGIAQDSKLMPDFWELPKALGAAGAQFPSGGAAMIDSVASGENVFGYDQLGSYARVADQNPSLGVIYPDDYILTMSRVAFLSKTAQNPNAGKLWLDYLLSARGQEILANQSELSSIRSDVSGEYTAAALDKKYGALIHPIPVDPSILEFLAPEKRLEFLNKWKTAVREAR